MSADGGDWEIELDHPVSLAIETSFAGEAPSAFGAPQPSSRPLLAPGFSGSVACGASCNCSTIALTPHCNATHTECAGHLTSQPLDALRIVPVGLIPAVLLSVTPDPAPDDRIVTRRLLEAAWPREQWPVPARALVLRTLPNDEAKRHRDYTDGSAPYLSAEAARALVERGIEHLIVDLPSIDRMSDEGRLAAHRVFFGLPPGATDLARAARAQCTITELAYVPDAVPDGEYLLELQIPALTGDAVPSRPLLYAAARITQRGRTAASGATRKRARTDGSGARRKRAHALARGGARSKHGRR
ncbi:MAG: cyclase family protein [Steroidobacteraceae bacterium]